MSSLRAPLSAWRGRAAADGSEPPMSQDSEKSSAPGGPAGSASARNAVKQATDALVKRMPPYNEEAEQAVLAGLFHYEKYWDDIFAQLMPDDFYVPRHQTIFQACLELFQQRAPIAPESLSEKLHGQGRLEEAGGLEYISTIYGNEVLGVSALFYAGMVRSKSMQRRLINTCASIMSTTFDTPYDQVEGLLDQAEQSIYTIAENAPSSTDLRSVGSLRDAFFNKLELSAKNPSALTGVTTGFADLDRMTGGLQASDLVIVAARPSMGKTAFALNLAINAASAGHKVAFFSLEMSAEQLQARLMSIVAKVPLNRVRQPHYLKDEDWQKLYGGADKLEVDLYIDDTPALRTMDLRAKCRRMKSRIGLDLVVVDYLQLMRTSLRQVNSREQEISDISRTLKAVAKELDIPVVALSQLNRKLEERDNKRPQMSDLRESGAIEQDADVIMFLYRDDVYAKRKKPAEGGSEPAAPLIHSPTEVIIGKQRNGPVGTVKLLYQCEYTSFEDLTVSYEDLPSENGILQ